MNERVCDAVLVAVPLDDTGNVTLALIRASHVSGIWPIAERSHDGKGQWRLKMSNGGTMLLTDPEDVEEIADLMGLADSLIESLLRDPWCESDD